MATGKIIKALSGFYYVQNESGIFQCRARGNFRKRSIKPLVGDEVEFEAENHTDGYVMDVFERKNELNRPPIANVDQALLVFSATEPDFSSLLLDRFLVHVEVHDIKPIIVISKMDLINDMEAANLYEYKQSYEQMGYRVIFTSTVEPKGLGDVVSVLNERVTVVAGQSGVGKSSLLNALISGLNMETNEISTHLGRGKHTTRHVELIPFGGGLVADTPGFSSLDFIHLEADELSLQFPEMRERVADCKFRGCTHTSEPGCAVKAALEQKEIFTFRYEHYLQFLDEIKSQKRRY
ncbi:ribosome small subunit-dependent GTPase A [Halalkalibacterium ligniniphilum]|uniref:ribosome small subunit-dependent GTPase A n=1 Tax=Halalkalibacterium ligniniphilum TaxID=1134413 RepID=UPI00034CB67D|nr:ribosome small subunit-dependent GTPase A [Halalkalibacterium ligniniphilum]